jgi:hypothetical protein
VEPDQVVNWHNPRHYRKATYTVATLLGAPPLETHETEIAETLNNQQKPWRLYTQHFFTKTTSERDDTTSLSQEPHTTAPTPGPTPSNIGLSAERNIACTTRTRTMEHLLLECCCHHHHLLLAVHQGVGHGLLFLNAAGPNLEAEGCRLKTQSHSLLLHPVCLQAPSALHGTC